MASTGPAVFPAATVFPNTNTYPGQGTQPIVRLRISYADAASTPVWVEVAPNKIRSWSVSRGRDSDFENVPAGTATIVLDNRDRAYDPT